MIQKERLKELINKYQAGQCSEEEIALLESWYIQWNEDSRVSLSEEQLDKASQRLLTELEPLITPKRTIKLWPRIAAAAAILLVIGAGLFFYTNTLRHPDAGKDPAVAGVNDIAPGKIGATLTLANGQKIVLSDAKNGKLAKESGVAISKTADGQLVYEMQSSSTEPNKTNTLSTAKGETYQVRLPDGTFVVLNAASSLEYPANFTALKERRVKLAGEGYFEVAKDKAHPFIVQTDKQIVEVLGTHFNINSYAYEQETKTTLLEGSVKVTSFRGKRSDEKSAILKPGEQSFVTTQFLKIIPVDIEVATAWKNGKFLFRNEKLESILNRLAYWYDVEIVYEGKIPTMAMSGIIERKRKLSFVLKLITITGGVKFRIEGRKLYLEK